MDRDQFIAQAVISGKTRDQAIALYAEAFPPAPIAPSDVAGFVRDVHPSGRVVETEILGDGSRRVVKDETP